MSLCSVLIYTDTSIGGKSTIGGILNDKATKKFDTSFKLEVVSMIEKQGLSVKHVGQSMGTVWLRSVVKWRNIKLSKMDSVVPATHWLLNNSVTAN